MSYARPDMQADFTHTQPQMQAAFDAVAQYAPLVTSVMHGEHVKGSAHYEGRAVDVGSFGGTAVGFNVPTWSAVMGAIGSGKFQKIGTLAAITSNAAAQAWAKQNGVELFEDEGSGPHVHFQVGS